MIVQRRTVEIGIKEFMDCQICALGFFCGCPEGTVKESEFSENCVKIEDCPPTIFEEPAPVLELDSLVGAFSLDYAIVYTEDPEPEGEVTTAPVLEIDNLEKSEPEPEGENTTDGIYIDDSGTDYAQELNELIESISGDENTATLF